MRPQPADVISAQPRAVFSRAAWVTVLAGLLAVALAGAITVAVHYRTEAASLRRQLRAASASRPPGAVPLALSSRTVALPRAGALTAEVTVLSARLSAGLEQIVLSAHITGGAPHTSYALTGFDCAGGSGYQSWAAGITGAYGAGNLSGHAWPVSPRDEYWLYLSPSSSGSAGPGVHGSFTAAGRWSAIPARAAPCP